MDLTEGSRTMASALVIEEESGTTRATRHPHNGYYAGDFGPRGTCSTTRSASKARVTAAHKTLARVPSLPRR